MAAAFSRDDFFFLRPEQYAGSVTSLWVLVLGLPSVYTSNQILSTHTPLPYPSSADLCSCVCMCLCFQGLASSVSRLVFLGGFQTHFFTASAFPSSSAPPAAAALLLPGSIVRYQYLGSHSSREAKDAIANQTDLGCLNAPLSLVLVAAH